jgi:iron complex outermembrane receptor protein
LGFGLGINYVSNRFGDLANTFEVGDYFLTNLALFYQRNNWRLGLNMNNLFDVSYISSTNNSRNFGNAPGAPLSVIGTISVEF